jgi:hypothetical protein
MIVTYTIKYIYICIIIKLYIYNVVNIARTCGYLLVPPIRCTCQALIAALGQHMPRRLMEATEGALRRGGVATAHQDVGETINALEEQRVSEGVYGLTTIFL